MMAAVAADESFGSVVGTALVTVESANIVRIFVVLAETDGFCYSSGDEAVVSAEV